MTLWRPKQNRDHLVDWSTKIVIQGNKTFKQLVTESLQDPTREWKDDKDIDLPGASLKGIATSLKARYQLTNLTIKGQVG